jgi:hypothetical protein
MAELQLRQPGVPLFGNIGILTTVYRASGEDQELIGCDIELTSVAISTTRVQHSEQSRIWVGSYLTARAPRDLIRSTFSIELMPLGDHELRAVLLEDIAAEEATVQESSATPEQLRASQRRRDELMDQLRRLESR